MDRSGRRRLHSRDNAEQRGLADAVGADYGDARPVGNADREAGEDVQGAEGLAKVMRRYERHDTSN